MKSTRRLFWTAMVVASMTAAVHAGDFDTEEGGSNAMKGDEPRIATMAQAEMVTADDKATKDYTLICDYTSGRKQGDLRSRGIDCRVSRRESWGDYHVELFKRNASRLVTQFYYRPSGYSYNDGVTLTVNHKATVRGRSYIDIIVNGQNVVWNWSPSSTSFHTSRWNLARYLRPGENEVVIRLSNSRSQYWFKWVKLNGNANVLFRDTPGGGYVPGPGNGHDPYPGNGHGQDQTWTNRMIKARKAFKYGQDASAHSDWTAARRGYDDCIRFCDEVIRNAYDPRLKEDARRLQQQARYAVQNLGGY